MGPVGNWSYPTAVRIGAGRIAELGAACAAAAAATNIAQAQPRRKA